MVTMIINVISKKSSLKMIAIQTTQMNCDVNTDIQKTC